MGTYHNDYDKKKDPMMWELHEIRHEMQEEKLTHKQISENAQKIIADWNNRHNKKLVKVS